MLIFILISLFALPNGETPSSLPHGIPMKNISACPSVGLQTALARYQRMQKNGGWPKIPEGPSLLSGVVDPRVSTLKQRLNIEEDLRLPETPLFNDVLAKALRNVQKR